MSSPPTQPALTALVRASAPATAHQQCGAGPFRTLVRDLTGYLRLERRSHARACRTFRLLVVAEPVSSNSSNSSPRGGPRRGGKHREFLFVFVVVYLSFLCFFVLFFSFIFPFYSVLGVELGIYIYCIYTCMQHFNLCLHM